MQQGTTEGREPATVWGARCTACVLVAVGCLIAAGAVLIGDQAPVEPSLPCQVSPGQAIETGAADDTDDMTPIDESLQMYIGFRGTWRKHTTGDSEEAEVRAALAVSAPGRDDAARPHALGQHAINHPAPPPGWWLFSPDDMKPMYLHVLARDQLGRLGSIAIADCDTGQAVCTIVGRDGGRVCEGCIEVPASSERFVLQLYGENGCDLMDGRAVVTCIPQSPRLPAEESIASITRPVTFMLHADRTPPRDEPGVIGEIAGGAILEQLPPSEGRSPVGRVEGSHDVRFASIGQRRGTCTLRLPAGFRYRVTFVENAMGDYAAAGEPVEFAVPGTEIVTLNCALQVLFELELKTERAGVATPAHVQLRDPGGRIVADEDTHWDALMWHCELVRSGLRRGIWHVRARPLNRSDDAYTQWQELPIEPSTRRIRKSIQIPERG